MSKVWKQNEFTILQFQRDSQVKADEAHILTLETVIGAWNWVKKKCPTNCEFHSQFGSKEYRKNIWILNANKGNSFILLINFGTLFMGWFSYMYTLHKAHGDSTGHSWHFQYKKKRAHTLKHWTLNNQQTMRFRVHCVLWYIWNIVMPMLQCSGSKLSIWTFAFDFSFFPFV